jgi:hypothetical protein
VSAIDGRDEIDLMGRGVAGAETIVGGAPERLEYVGGVGGEILRVGGEGRCGEEAREARFRGRVRARPRQHGFARPHIRSFVHRPPPRRCPAAHRADSVHPNQGAGHKIATAARPTKACSAPIQ